MLEHVKKITKILSKKTSLKKGDLVLDIASNDGSLLNFYNKILLNVGIDPILNKYKKNYKKIKYAIPSFFSLKK